MFPFPVVSTRDSRLSLKSIVDVTIVSGGVLALSTAELSLLSGYLGPGACEWFSEESVQGDSEWSE